MNYKNQIRKWNGWGKNGFHLYDQNIIRDLKSFLSNQIGEVNFKIKEITKEELLKKVSVSSIKINDPILKNIFFLEKEIRLDYSFGQSFPDWISFKTGWNLEITDAVAFPSNIEELKLLYDYCKKNQYKILIYGGGTSVVGHIRPENHPVITISMEKLNKVLEVNKENSFAIIQAGANGPEIENQLQKYGYRLGHYPQSFELSTLGGWIATRSSGQQSLYYGKIEDIFLGGKVLTDKGEWEIIPNPASSAGPDLKYWILGSEGRTSILYEAIVKIRKLPETEEFYGVFFKDVFSAINFIKQAIQLKTSLSMIRLSFPEETLINLEMAKATGYKNIIENLIKYLSFRGYKNQFCMMILGFTGTKKEVHTSKKIIIDLIKDFNGLIKPYFISKKLGKSWEKNRFYSPYLRNTLWELGYGVDTLETCLPWNKIIEAKNKIEFAIKEAAKKHNEEIIVYTHLSHIYLNGSSLYTTYLFRLKESPEELFQFWKDMKQAASKVITELKGTISHQHGVGKDHKTYLVFEKGQIGMEWIKNYIKNADPHQLLNNNNLIDIDHS
ncbi:MAG: FAD-binding oxidoreductase [Candidatus Sericytochromatia bacterium]|nr:MAG: FAD-binding oxidoreductase [Candidatus Sericytochromatia bacterium]GIX41201.1 MAG: FAD-binding oxidoreductase [Leptospiraceae bacterium]